MYLLNLSIKCLTQSLQGIILCSIILVMGNQASDIQPRGGAELVIEWTYENPKSQLENGVICDRIGISECDVYFTFCLDNAASSPGSCLLLQRTTSVYQNSQKLSFQGNEAMKIFIPKPVPNSYSFLFNMYDSDMFSSQELIASLKSSNFALYPNNKSTKINMTRVNSNHKNTDLKVHVYMRLTCTENFYGNHCKVYCKPDPEKYSCGPDGTYICVPGLRGELCDKEDSCYYEKCADHATCINKEDGSGRVCICDGKDNPECYPDYNPCASEPCQNGGSCEAVGQYNESFKCFCPRNWTGHRCHERISACLLEAIKLTEESNADFNVTGNETQYLPVCLNGGSCFEHPTNFEARCVCNPEWTGKRCELPADSETKTHQMMIIVIAVMAVILILIIIFSIIGLIWRRIRYKRAVEFNNKHGAIVYYHNPRDSTHSMGSTVPLSQHFVNNTYGDTRSIEPILVKRPSINNYKKPETCSGADVYDECDPLGLYAGEEFYGTAYPKENHEQLRNSIESKDTHKEYVPPLPKRPNTFGVYSSDLTNQNSTFNSTLTVSTSPSNDSISDLSRNNSNNQLSSPLIIYKSLNPRQSKTLTEFDIETNPNKEINSININGTYIA